MELSKRMQAVAGLVPAGHIVADVGCDHGFVAIYLVQEGICAHVYAADVRSGPLQRAKKHIAENGLEDRITTVLSDGLKKVPVGMCSQSCRGIQQDGGPQDNGAAGADIMIAAGMGGRLTIRILSDVPKKTAQLSEVILEPQSEVWLVRRWLGENGFVIIAEEMVLEEGKYYPVIRAANGAAGKSEAAKEAVKRQENLKSQMAAAGLTDREIETAFERFGPMLILKKSAVLLSFLEHTIEKDNELLEKMPDSEAAEKAERIRRRVGELQERIRLAQSMLKLLEGERFL